ncbi:DUF1707 domain-containing protein [Streptomyces sp. CBMA123]|uniref:DUF1707 SHOCT-like domain-containing protein n=1 Tax=Streptomyces sp. CBMA123 TaxID=1896313 RepID=UPI001661BBEF|nr:DUF1707 domain-containing protein [Streptomyces sp. CBMA123]MBD0689607.1 hypothetical protein [Streptomyces sp. CBMA123]
MAAGTDEPPPIAAEDRDTAVRRLREAYGQGQFPHEELDDRLHRALTAATHDELTGSLTGLPEPPPPATATITGAAPGGRIHRRGVWEVPRTLTVASALGRVRLDLSRAVIAHPVVDIELYLGTGGAAIIVPRDAVVDLGGLRTGRKAPRYRPRRPARPGGPVIRISGGVGLGRLSVRHARW